MKSFQAFNPLFRLKSIIIIILSTTTIHSAHGYGFFDVIDLYDGVECSMKILDKFLSRYNRFLCCSYWKLKWFMQLQARKHCEQPENLNLLLDGDSSLNDYIDLSSLNCTRYGENSNECKNFWFIFISVIVGQILLFLLFFTTTIVLLYSHCTDRKQPTKLIKSINKSLKHQLSLISNGPGKHCALTIEKSNNPRRANDEDSDNSDISTMVAVANNEMCEKLSTVPLIDGDDQSENDGSSNNQSTLNLLFENIRIASSSMDNQNNYNPIVSYDSDDSDSVSNNTENDGKTSRN